MAATLAVTAAQPKEIAKPWRSAGVWIAILTALYILTNVARAVLDPVAFAAAFGTPLANPADIAFVWVYAARSVFLSIFVLALIATGQFRTLRLFAFLAVVMPLGDAAIVTAEQGPPWRIGLHLLVAAILLLTAYLLSRALRKG